MRSTIDPNLSNLEVIYVLKNIKPCCRVIIDDSTKQEFCDFCYHNNLCICFSDYKIVPIYDKNKMGFSNRMERVPTTLKGGKIIAYISKYEKIVEFAKHYEHERDHTSLGKLLGYPECCINFYTGNREQALKNQDDYMMLIPTKDKIYPFYNNYAIRCFGVSLISHFPCSLDCKNSKDIAQKNLNFLRKEFPQTAIFFEKELKSFVICAGENGIFYSSDYKKEGNTIFFNALKSTVKNEIFCKLEKEKKSNSIHIMK